MTYPTRAQVRQFGREVKKGDRFTNRWEEHGKAPRSRILEVVLDVRGTPLFALKELDNMGRETGKTTVMRGRTLLKRYARL